MISTLPDRLCIANISTDACDSMKYSIREFLVNPCSSESVASDPCLQPESLPTGIFSGMHGLINNLKEIFRPMKCKQKTLQPVIEEHGQRCLH